jgi:hypothetical protein
MMRSLLILLALTVLGACANFFALESDVSKETRKTRERCEAAAKAGADTTAVCRTFLVP